MSTFQYHGQLNQEFKICHHQNRFQGCNFWFIPNAEYEVFPHWLREKTQNEDS